PALPPDPDPETPPGLGCLQEEEYVSQPDPPTPPPPCRDAETLTDVCNTADLPEVEIISLLEEQLPVYRLRADTVYGYDHDDWLHTPLLSPDARIDLTTEQIEETLKYFLLCADRVGQMTKTYNDIDAVTRLLEEKERDLELAARIGQSLLRKNRTLTEQNDFLEEQVGRITEEVAQLHHELNLKDELLQFYTHTVDDGEEESTVSSPMLVLLGLSGSGADSMQRKLRELEEENLSLRTEACHLKTETETYEEKEQQLVNDCVKELKQSSLQINTIAEELARKTEDAMRQQEEITHLLSQIVDLQKKAKSYALENEELSQHLGAAKDAQRQLTAELTDLDDKYTECLEMLHEAQEEVKNLRNRSYPAGTPRRFHPLGLYPMDSLAAEIEGTMRKEMSLEDPECEEQKEHHKRVFETVKNINQTVRQRSPVPSNANIPGSNQASSLSSTHSSGRTTPRGDVRGDGVALDNRQQSMLMDVEARAKKAAGVEDLRLALRRLSLRRQNNLSERRFFEEERGRRRGGGVPQDGSGGHGGGMTPSDSIMSLGTLHLWASRPYLPDKLQIVKPLEGSATLHHWQQLAQPHLGVILDARPGVVPKGFRPLELELEQVYPWGGFEEDEPGDQYFQTVYYPGKCMAHTSSTYTFTTCRILHPTDELTRVTPSVNPGLSSSSCVMTSSILATPAGTPSHPPRRMSLLRPSESSTNLRDATRTTSTSLGLVRLLQERGLGTPHPVPLRPTTPPNSPTGHNPPTSGTNTPAGFDFKSPSYDNFLASKPARSILKDVAGTSGGSRSRRQQRGRDCESQTDVSVTVHNLNLVDKVKRLGVAGGPPGHGGVSGGPSQMLGPLGGLRRSGSPFGPDSMRRNRSYPAMVGASMAMKGPGPQEDSELLLPPNTLPKQKSLK
uniref:Trafficking protein, kinesin binding 1a n=1 Tax=Esox lucius TaxID=8010 RepID=A0A3P8ZCM5_ESOLU